MWGRAIYCRYALIILSCASFLSGCNYVQLRRNTLQQSRTIRDVYCQQVLDNLAMFSAAPQAVPFCCLLDTGTVQVETTATAAGTFTWNPRAIMTEAFAPMLQRKSSGSWVLRPVNDAEALRRMRCVYQVASGNEGITDPLQCAKCGDVFPDPLNPHVHDPCKIPPPGWYRCGGPRDVPHEAVLVGCHNERRIWVVPGGEESLARLTMTIYSLAYPFKSVASGPQAGKADARDLIGVTGNESREELIAKIQQLRGRLDALKQAPPPVQIIQPQQAPFNPTQSMVPIYGT